MGLTARWQNCVKFHRIQRNYSASFSDILQGVSQWGILVFHFLALKQFSKLENFSKSPPLTSLHFSIRSSVSVSMCQAVCGWTPGRGGSREQFHICDEQRAAGQREDRPNFALSDPRAISEPGHKSPCRPWRSPTAQGALKSLGCTHSAAPRIAQFISVSLSVFPFQLCLKLYPPKFSRAQQLSVSVVEGMLLMLSRCLLSHPPRIMQAVMRLITWCRWLRINNWFQNQSFQPRLLWIYFICMFWKRWQIIENAVLLQIVHHLQWTSTPTKI